MRLCFFVKFFLRTAFAQRRSSPTRVGLASILVTILLAIFHFVLSTEVILCFVIIAFAGYIYLLKSYKHKISYGTSQTTVNE